MYKFAMPVLVSLQFLGSAASASPSRPDILDLVPREIPHRDEIKGCLLGKLEAPDGKVADPKAVVAACDKALTLEPYNSGETKARFLHYRAFAKLRARDFFGAIVDADRSAAVDSSGWSIHNLQCWTRIAANKDLAAARKYCAKAIELGGVKPHIVDSLAMLSIREKNWRSANEQASLLAESNRPGWEYSYLLSSAAFVAAKECSEDCIERIEQKRAHLLAKISKEGLREAETTLADMGIRLEDVTKTAAADAAKMNGKTE